MALNERYTAFAFAEGRKPPFSALDNADFMAWIERAKGYALDRNKGVRMNRIGELVILDQDAFSEACWGFATK